MVHRQLEHKSLLYGTGSLSETRPPTWSLKEDASGCPCHLVWNTSTQASSVHALKPVWGNNFF